MGFRFRKSIRLAKGVNLNIGSKSAGISIGGKGARIGINSKRGMYTSAGIPGTGIYSINYLGKSSSSTKESSNNSIENNITLPQELQDNFSFGCAWSFLSLILLTIPPLGILSILGQIITFNINKNKPKAKARAAFIKGVNLYKEGDYQNALEEFRKVKELYSNINDLNLITGEINFNLENFETAIDSFKKYLSSNDDNNTKIKLAYSYLFNNQTDQSVTLFQSVTDKENICVITGLATCFIQQEKPETALEVLLAGPTQKRKMTDELVEFRYLLGICYQKLNNTKKALTQFNKVYSYDATYKDVNARIQDLSK